MPNHRGPGIYAVSSLVLALAWPCGVVAAPAPAALAAMASEESAGGHHAAGREAAADGRFDAAIAEYRRAYELKADASYLLDIAEAYRALGAAERAVFFYRRYLATHGNPPNRPEVEAHIARLEPSLPPIPLPTPITAIQEGPATVPIESPSAHTISEGERSVIGRWWFWTAVGALAAASATVAILAADREGTSTEVPRSALGNARVEF